MGALRGLCVLRVLSGYNLFKPLTAKFAKDRKGRKEKLQESD